MIRTLFFIIIASLTLTACQSSPKKASKPSTPSWFLNPPADTLQTLYAVGTGETQQQAVQDALAYLSAKLNVSVSSSTQIHKTVYDGAYTFRETQLNKQTTTEIKQVTINQFTQLKMQQLGYEKFVTLIQSDKNKLAKDYQNKLNQQIKQFKENNNLHNHLPGYTKYRLAHQHYLQLANFNDTLSIYKGLKPTASILHYQAYIKEVTSYTKQQQQQTIFKITSNDNDSKTTLTQYINSIGFKVAHNKPTNLIKLTNQIKHTNAEGFSIQRNHLQVQFYENNHQASGNTLNLKGQGLNKQQAKTNLQAKLKAKLTTQGLNQFIGLNLNLNPANNRTHISQNIDSYNDI